MKSVYLTITLITIFLHGITSLPLRADNLKKTFNITVLNTAGDPQTNLFLKISGYSEEHPIDEQGVIRFEHEINKSYIRTANLYFLQDKEKPVKSFQLDESVTDTIFRIDSPEDLTRFKQSGRLISIHGKLTYNNKPFYGAEIQIQGTGRKTTSDAEGGFSIEADYSHLIVIRAEGMENRYLEIQSFLTHPDEPLAISLKAKGSDRIYASVDQMPEYPGGMKAFFNYVKRKLHPSQLAEETDREGVVMIQFVVEKDGNVTSPSIVRSLDAKLDTAALQVIQSMPRWIAGKDNGKTVRCKYSVPVQFKKPKPVAPADTTLQAKQQATTAPTTMQTLRPSFLKPEVLLPKPAFTAADSLYLEIRKEYFIRPEAPQPEKKGNFFTRFFRRLFGKKDA